MEMTGNPKLNLTSSLESCGSEEEMTPEKISISDQNKSDSFVIDMESFSHGPNKDTNQNSTITLQRSLSRKGFQRIEKKINSNTTANNRDSFVASSPHKGSSMPEKQVGVALGTTADHGGSSCSSPQAHHQIAITAGSITTTALESRLPFRRNSFKRSASPWLDPKRVLLIFATLSSMGTILLIYFTLSISKMNGDENTLD